ncbi:hypothetical protein PV04_05004 [Phialophora macrospora]|uniref:Uncharacterized protein n=1 Tax=Phialophora macrospora TaxID=1851006 RepID=A0A0D2GAS2_9EURO|nr:hypothetical protein PV04_05004 [Phialophora macrospora]
MHIREGGYSRACRICECTEYSYSVNKASASTNASPSPSASLQAWGEACVRTEPRRVDVLRYSVFGTDRNAIQYGKQTPSTYYTARSSLASLGGIWSAVFDDIQTAVSWARHWMTRSRE